MIGWSKGGRLRMAEEKVMYLCDKKKECSNSTTCGGEYCHHTFDVTHALHGPCDNPEKSGRFHLCRDVWVEDSTDEAKLLEILRMMPGKEFSNARAVVVESYIQENGPLPDFIGDMVKELMMGENNESGN